MFNKKLENRLENRLEKLEKLLLVEDYFSCWKCGKEKIPKFGAKKINTINGLGQFLTLYTTEKNYDKNLAEIKELEKYAKLKVKAEAD